LLWCMCTFSLEARGTLSSYGCTFLMANFCVHWHVFLVNPSYFLSANIICDIQNEISMKDLPKIISISIFILYTTWYKTKHSSTQTNASIHIRIWYIIISNKISVSFVVSYILPNDFVLAKFCYSVKIFENYLENQFFQQNFHLCLQKE
jgi:hypothetical protein